MANQIDPKVFARLLDEARAIRSFLQVVTVDWPEEDDRDDEMRVADFVAWRAGYTATTAPTYEEIAMALSVALRDRNDVQLRGSRAEIEVRRHNGQCAYGPWERYSVGLHPYDLGEELAEVDGDDGIVEVGGRKWAWRWIGSAE